MYNLFIDFIFFCFLLFYFLCALVFVIFITFASPCLHLAFGLFPLAFLPGVWLLLTSGPLLHLLLLPLGARKGCSYFKTKLRIMIFVQIITHASSTLEQRSQEMKSKWTSRHRLHPKATPIGYSKRLNP